MTSLKKDLNELRNMIHNNHNNELKGKIKEQIHIYNMFNNMLDQYRTELNAIINEYNNKSNNSIFKCMDDNMNNVIHYDKESDTYNVNINGSIIKGNIGNIYNYKDDEVKNTIECDYENCKRIKCIHNIHHRNFYNNSWTYNINNKHTRNIGGKNTIIEDLNRMSLKEKKQEYNLRSSQMIHDILILDKLIVNINDEENISTFKA